MPKQCCVASHAQLYLVMDWFWSGHKLLSLHGSHEVAAVCLQVLRQLGLVMPGLFVAFLDQVSCIWCLSGNNVARGKWRTACAVLVCRRLLSGFAPVLRACMCHRCAAVVAGQFLTFSA